ARDLAAAGMGTLKPFNVRPSTLRHAQGSGPSTGSGRTGQGDGSISVRVELVEAPQPSFPCPVTIRTDDPEGCPAFYGRVIRSVRNGPSPEWLQSALRDAGQRPISALVDLTNYLMLGFGRPAHAYDLAKLSGARSEEHTSELQSRENIVCRLLLEKKKHAA